MKEENCYGPRKSKLTNFDKSFLPSNKNITF
jgi:hypothetical protein